MRPKATHQVIDSKVAREFTRMVNASLKSQQEIAREAGFAKSNIITMLKQGRSKVPISRVVALARACEADPAKFMIICLSEYHPEIVEALGRTLMLTEDEAIVMETIRHAKRDLEDGMRRREFARARTPAEQESAKLLRVEYGNTPEHRQELYAFIFGHLLTSPDWDERQRTRKSWIGPTRSE